MFKNCVVGKITGFWCRKCKCGKCDFYRQCKCTRKDINRRQEDFMQLYIDNRLILEWEKDYTKVIHNHL